MDISVNKISETKLMVKVAGKIDLDNAGEFGMTVKDELDGITDLILDFEDVNYISSIGLRVLFEFQKQMKTQGSMTIVHVKPEVMNVFKMTGLDKLLSIVEDV
ncbi:STAS domain-containing protein [bacterium]|nr:STAS domain-containing protein [bacterium]